MARFAQGMQNVILHIYFIICKKCRFVENEGSGFVEGEHMILNEKDSFEAVEKFCYLGDMLSAGGGAD